MDNGIINNIGHKKRAGRPKGRKNKATLLMVFTGMTDADKQEIFLQAMKLVKKGNVNIINKLLDKMLPNADTKQLEEALNQPVHVIIELDGK